MPNDRYFKFCFLATCLLMAVMFSFGLGRPGSVSWRVAVLPPVSSQVSADPSAQKMRGFMAEGKFSDKVAMFWK